MVHEHVDNDEGDESAEDQMIAAAQELTKRVPNSNRLFSIESTTLTIKAFSKNLLPAPTWTALIAKFNEDIV